MFNKPPTGRRLCAVRAATLFIASSRIFFSDKFKMSEIVDFDVKTMDWDEFYHHSRGFRVIFPSLKVYCGFQYAFSLRPPGFAEGEVRSF